MSARPDSIGSIGPTGPDAPPALVGIDVGGTAIKAGRVDPGGRIGCEGGADVPPGCDSAALLALLIETAREMGCRDRLGIGVPGLLDRERGLVTESPNLHALDGLPLRDELARALGIEPARVYVGNDADVAALGEQWLGASRDVRNVLMITLGTGIGGGLILNGELFTGEGMGCEIGHLTVDPGGPRCGCGGLGCLEALASATAARRRARERGLPAERPGDLPLLAERARAGEAPEAELLEAVGRDLGRGLGAVISLVDVRCFVFSGGFSAALDVLEPGIRRGIRESTYGERVGQIRLLRATLGTRAGWIGAARLGLP